MENIDSKKDVDYSDLNSSEGQEKNKKIMRRLVICVVILFIGFAGNAFLTGLKKPPAVAKPKDTTIGVEVMKVKAEDIQVTITGYGEAKPIDIVTVSSEVSGRIVSVHPRLEVGEVLNKNDIIFRVDDRDYIASANEARSVVNQSKNSILRLKKQFEIDTKRKQTLARNADISKSEYKRVKKLYEKNRVGSRSSVDAREQAYNQARDLLDQMDQSLELFPIMIKEAENGLSAAKARLDRAETALSRCTVKAQLTSRIKAVSIENGQFVAPGAGLITLSNDSTLEIRVPIDSRDASKWLEFTGSSANKSLAWFNDLKHVKCKIEWTEAKSGDSWSGTIHRVVEFNKNTRTIILAVRVPAEEAISGNGLPLVEGMFCKIKIPGKTIKNVIRVPRWAVTFDGRVYTSVNNRLKTKKVEIARNEEDKTFVSTGLNSGDIVIITRLVDPLEKSLLSTTTKQ